MTATNGAQHTDYSIVGAGSANGMQFIFEFDAPQYGDADYGVDHYINFVFGDYDVSPAQIKVDGIAYGLTLQGSQDGLVQKAYATVPWSAMEDGKVVITIEASREPYLAFDYALLDTDQIADVDGDGLGDVCDSDNDNDGIENEGDLCPGTLAGPVNFDGCSVDQVCECDADWKNHGEFMSCISHTTEEMLFNEIITEDEKDEIVSTNAKKLVARR